MNLKIHFFHSHLEYFLESCRDGNDKYGKRIYKWIANMEYCNVSELLLDSILLIQIIKLSIQKFLIKNSYVVMFYLRPRRFVSNLFWIYLLFCKNTSFARDLWKSQNLLISVSLFQLFSTWKISISLQQYY